MIDLDGLNASQRQAATHLSGPCLCIAGPGSGKTHTLTTRVAYLVDQGVDPGNIAVMTFTKKAANELQDRLQSLIGDAAILEMAVGTIHALCYRILRDAWRMQGTQPYTIIDERIQRRIVRDLLAPASRDNPSGLNWELDLKVALARISRWKNDLVTPAMIDVTQPDGALWQTLYTRYDKIKERDRHIDLDDLLIRTYEALRTMPPLLRQYQHQWPWLLTDEAQDNNQAQWEILYLLMEPQRNLFLVADYDQSLYGFRGARPEQLIAFTQRYPETVIVNLDKNYRSLPYIVTLGNQLIQGNPRQLPKRLDPVRPASTVTCAVWSPEDEREEAAETVRYLETLHTEGAAWADMAVLYRTNAQSQPLEDALVQAQIPYRIIGSKGFWNRREVKDILAYLRVMVHPQDEEAFARALMAPSRYLGHAYLREITAYARSRNLRLIDALMVMPGKPYQTRNAVALYQIFRAVETLTRPADMIEAIRDLTDYDRWFLAESTEGDDEDRLANLGQLSQVASQFSSPAALVDHADRMLSQATDDAATADRVSLMTVHRSKGLEFDTVITVGWVEGVLPHRRALAEDEDSEDGSSIEEERRIAYVAVTRAKDRLVVSVPRVVRNRDVEPSRFVAEMGLGVPVHDSA